MLRVSRVMLKALIYKEKTRYPAGFFLDAIYLIW